VLGGGKLVRITRIVIRRFVQNWCSAQFILTQNMHFLTLFTPKTNRFD
jgi:hypothetical protein